MKIIIDIRNDMDPVLALQRVTTVVSEGKVSEAAGIKHYCWATGFSDNTVVWVQRKRNKTSADSFVVITEEVMKE